MTSSNDTPDGEDRHDDAGASYNGGAAGDAIPRPKRIACILCRKRKLRCDGNKPSCGTCYRLNHICEYSEERKKSGPKRGYVKLLEARLKQVENLLETRDGSNDTAHASNSKEPDHPTSSMNLDDIAMDQPIQDPEFSATGLDGMADFSMNTGDEFSWEMIGLGLEEALPPPEMIDELNQIYFDQIHPSVPMIHKARFLASMDLAPHMRPAVFLRYAMWTHACVASAKYTAYAEHFYARARKYAELDEMRGHGESIITVAHAQAWTLISVYEFKVMYFPRAWMSVGRGARLCQMMGLHRQDRVGLDVKQTLPPPRDWTDREERRRTFWMAYCQDRYASIGTGWPMTFDENDILTNLPATEEAFKGCQPEPTLQLADIMSGEGAASLSSMGGVILLATIYGRNLIHLHRPADTDNDHDLNGPFWKRHRALDNIILNTALALSPNLRLPAGLNDPNTIFLNMNIHTATICLHQAAIFKADKNRLPAQISAESKRRCIVAADQVTNIMKMISHLDMSVMNPFLAFCLYVSARVFVQYLKARRDDAAVKSSLHFLLAAMQVLTAKNPLTESFLVQLDVDLEGSGLDIPTSHSRWKFGHRPLGEVPINTDSVKCSPIFEIRESQGPALGQFSGPQPRPEVHELGLGGVKQSSTSSDYPSLYGATDAPTFNSNAPTMTEGIENPFNFSSGPSMGSHTSPGGNSYHDSTGSRPQSNHPTPSTSSIHNSSSHNSYTSPQNQSISGGSMNSTSSNNNPSTQARQDPPLGYIYPGSASWQASVSMTSGGVAGYTGGVRQQQHQHQQEQQMPDNNIMPPNMHMNSTGMTPNATTGMTPISDLWPAEGMTDNNDWMFGWPGQTPQPQ